MFILDKCFAALHEDLKQDIFQGRARPSLGVVHRYIKYIKKREASRAAACRPALLAIPPFAVGSYPFVRGWVLPSSCFTPFVVGPYLSSLCFTPFAVGFLPLRAAGAIAFVWFDTKTGAKGGEFDHPLVQHEGGFVLVGAKAAVRLGLGVVVVVP